MYRRQERSSAAVVAVVRFTTIRCSTWTPFSVPVEADICGRRRPNLLRAAFPWMNAGTIPSEHCVVSPERSATSMSLVLSLVRRRDRCRRRTVAPASAIMNNERLSGSFGSRADRRRRKAVHRAAPALTGSTDPHRWRRRHQVPHGLGEASGDPLRPAQQVPIRQFLMSHDNRDHTGVASPDRQSFVDAAVLRGGGSRKWLGIELVELTAPVTLVWPDSSASGRSGAVATFRSSRTK